MPFLRKLACFIIPMITACAAAVAGAQPALHTMEVGQTKVIRHASVSRVAVGNGQVVSAVSVDGREVVLFAKQEGASSVHVWGPEGVIAAYDVQVRPAGWAQLHQEVQTLLSHIPNVRSSSVGDNIVIEGEDLGDDDRERVAALVRRFPRILDFTGQVGWDRMVLLDVQVVELPSTHLRDFGVDWDAKSHGGLQTGMLWQAGGKAQLASGAAPAPLAMAGSGVGGYFGMNALLSSRISALAQQGEAVMLAQPQLLARSGATASFLAGGEVPYTTTDANGRSHTQFKPYGVSLNITPRIDRNGAIRSRIEVEASSVDMSLSVASGPALRTRRASTEFNVRSGQTLVIGGFLSRERSHEKKGLPVLQDIPGLSALFSTQRDRRTETELAIFVTPRIVSQDQPELAQRVQQGRDILNDAFPEPARMGMDTLESGGPLDWSQDRGEGSQWQQSPENTSRGTNEAPAVLERFSMRGQAGQTLSIALSRAG